MLAEARSLQPPDEHLLLMSWGRKTYFKRIGPTEFQLFLHGVAFSHMLQSALYAVGITLPGVQRALCTSAPRWGANLYTDIGLMALKSPILVTWPAGR